MTERTGLLFTHWKKIASPHPQDLIQDEFWVGWIWGARSDPFLGFPWVFGFWVSLGDLGFQVPSHAAGKLLL